MWSKHNEPVNGGEGGVRACWTCKQRTSYLHRNSPHIPESLCATGSQHIVRADRFPPVHRVGEVHQGTPCGMENENQTID